MLEGERVSVDENDESHICRQRNGRDRPVGVSVQVTSGVFDIV